VINNNTIGSPTISQSINNATYGNTFGIIERNTFAGPNQSITNNTVANIAQTYSTSTNNPTIRGLYCGSGITNTTGNIIYNITSAAPNVGTGTAASVIGIYAPATTSSSAQTLSQNNVFNIYNTNTTAATTAIGICATLWAAPVSGTNLVSGNKVRSVYVSNATGNAQGLNIISSNSTTYQNNDIELGLDNANNPITSVLAFQGITEGANINNNFYFNTVRVTGSGVSGTTPSTYAFNSTSTIDIIKDNIFVNDRSGGTTGSHYAISAVTGATLNYNDYYVSGTGTMLGYNGSSNVTSIPILTGQDVNSVSLAPGFISTTNLQLTNSPIIGLGVTIPSIPTDFLGVTRFNPPTIGAYESIPPCTAPANQPTTLILTPSTTTVSGSFTASTGTPAADHYLIVRNTTGTVPSTPVNGTIYSSSTQLTGATFIAYQTGTSITDAGLTGNTQYYYYIYAAKTTSCLNGPAYLATSPLTGNVTTNCSSPIAQPTLLTLAAGSTTVSGAFTAEISADHYLIIRSTLNTISATPLNGHLYNVSDLIGGGTVLAYQTGTSFADAGLLWNTQYYYYIFAANSNCSNGPVYLTTLPLTGNSTTTIPPVSNKTLKVTAMFQEYYNGSGMNQTQGIDWNSGNLFNNFGGTIVDTLTVLIRQTNVTDPNNPCTIDTALYGQNLNIDGTITPISIPAGITGYHYIVIIHRNSIETWSDSVNFSNDTINYNFYTHISQFAQDGGSYIDGSNLAYIWGGDVNQNGNLESEDATAIYVAAISDDETVNNGYVINDIDGNGNIDSQDYGLAYSNSLIGANIINPFSYQKKK